MSVKINKKHFFISEGKSFDSFVKEVELTRNDVAEERTYKYNVDDKLANNYAKEYLGTFVQAIDSKPNNHEVWKKLKQK